MAEKASKPMRTLVIAVAGPGGGNTKSIIARAARNARVSYRTAKSIFYGDITDDEHKAVRRMKLAAGHHEASELADRFQGLAVALKHRDPAFHSQDIVALLHAARALRSMAGPGDVGEE